MDYLRYLDFEVIFSRQGEKLYRAHVFNSPAGEAIATFAVPFEPLKLENLILRLTRLRSSTRAVDSAEVAAARELGSGLFAAVFQEDILACYRASLEKARAQANTGLRLKLRLQDVSELADLPWEFLYDVKKRQFLAQSVETPLVRYIELPESIAPLQVELPLRILGIISSPSDCPALNTQHEKDLLQQALAPLIEQRQVQIDWLQPPTLNGLRQALRKNTYHIFHFIGHGGFEKDTEQGMLIFEDSNHFGQRVTSSQLGVLLHDHRSLRLAVLNACEGARNTPQDPFAGVAANLLLQGLPAAVAMQFAISDSAALAFSADFYSMLAHGWPIDAAVAEGRKAIYCLPDEIEWGTPIVYLRSSDSVLFDLHPYQPVPASLQPNPAAPRSGVESTPKDFENLSQHPPGDVRTNDSSSITEKGEITRQDFRKMPAEPRKTANLKGTPVVLTNSPIKISNSEPFLMNARRKVPALLASLIALVVLLYLWEDDLVILGIITFGLCTVILAVGSFGWYTTAHIADPLSPFGPVARVKHPILTPGWLKAARITLTVAILGWAAWGIYQGYAYQQERQMAEMEGKVVILVAKIDGPDSNNYRITEVLLNQLKSSVAVYEDVTIVSFDEIITERLGSDYARKIGAERKADIVIWGNYGTTATDVRVTLHVEEIAEPDGGNTIRSQSSIAELDSFTLQQDVSKQMTGWIFFLIGYAQLQAENYTVALERFDQALELLTAIEDSANRARVLLFRGKALEYLNRWDEAIVNFNGAILLDNGYDSAYYNRGIAYAKLGQFEAAITDHTKAIEINPTYANAFYGRGLVYTYAGQDALALADFQQAIRLTNDPNLRAQIEKSIQAIPSILQPTP